MKNYNFIIYSVLEMIISLGTIRNFLVPTFRTVASDDIKMLSKAQRI